ncbi:MAG: alpha/beta hydrolase [Clostridia bacterium]|nr:alpha/beta hydrolase [Clostridia bacterium]
MGENKKTTTKTKAPTKDQPASSGKKLYVPSFDESLIYTYTWTPAKKPKGVVFIIHGMVEHIARYDYFAKKCNDAGLLVFGMDLRAHGKTVGEADKVGKYDGDLFGDCVKDVIFMANKLHEQYKLPLILLGHSYGSFVLQEVVQQYKDYDLAVFSGSANMKGQLSVVAGKIVAKITRAFKGKDAPGKMLYKLSFGAYGKGLEKGNWLTRDESIFDKYVADPFCGNVCSAQFYVSFFEHLSKLYKKANLQKIEKTKPMLIVSGACDPVGGKNHKLVDKLFDLYKGLNLNVNCKIFDDCRHEILNELNKDEIIQFILDFCNEKLK